MDVEDAVAWTASARPVARSEVAAHDDVMCQKASLAHSP